MTDTQPLVAFKTIKILSVYSKAATYLLNFLLHDFLWLISSLNEFSILAISFNLYFISSVKLVLSPSMELH